MLEFVTTEHGILQRVKKDIYGRATFTSPDFKSLVEAKTNAKERIKIAYFFSPSREDYLQIIKDFSKVTFPNVLDGTTSNYIPPIPVSELLSNKDELDKWQRQSYRLVIQVNNPVDPTFPFYLYTVQGKVTKIGK